MHKRHNAANNVTNETYIIKYNILLKGEEFWKIAQEVEIELAIPFNKPIKCNHDKASQKFINQIAGTYSEIKIVSVTYV